MKHKNLIIFLSSLIAILSIASTLTAILSSTQSGPESVISVRGEKVQLYGKGVYRHMSAEVAPQGIAQDYVTLFFGVPMLLLSLFIFRKDTLKGRILLTGVLGYFLVKYTFYTLMAMYNELFLLWVILLSLSFHAFILTYNQIDEAAIPGSFDSKLNVKFVGGFLIFNSIAVALLWLSIVLPTALSGTIPKQVEHYTTLVVQALDLAIALPASFIAGYYIRKRTAFGLKLGSIYIIFLFLQMTALSAKIIAMGILGYNIIPVVFIIPAFNLIALVAMVKVIGSLKGGQLKP